MGRLDIRLGLVCFGHPAIRQLVQRPPQGGAHER